VKGGKTIPHAVVALRVEHVGLSRVEFLHTQPKALLHHVTKLHLHGRGGGEEKEEGDDDDECRRGGGGGGGEKLSLLSLLPSLSL